MAYICKACSYRGKKGGARGECPACGAFDMVLEGAVKREEVPRNNRLRIILLGVTWSWFLGLVIWKMLD